MKKATPILMSLLIAMLLMACSSRQSPPTPEIPSVDKRLYTLKHRLSLTDTQMTKIKPILEEEHQRKLELMQAFKDEGRDGMRDNRQKMEDLEWDIYKKLSEYLTPDQMDIYSKLLEEEKQKMMDKMRNGRGGRGGRGGRR